MLRPALVSLVVTFLLLAAPGCTTEVELGDQLPARGYHQLETLQDTVQSVQAAGEGQWDVRLGKSARSYRLLRELSPNADQLVARARELQASQQPCLFTIAVHDTAPRSKTAPSAIDASAAKSALAWPWVIVEIDAEPKPPSERPR